MSKTVASDLDFGSVAKALNLPSPTASGDAATKGYVDSAIEGLAWKDNARVATTANLTLTGPGSTIDGIAMALNDRVLVKNQSAAADNGIYIWNGAAVTMTRAADASTAIELEQAIVSVNEGTSAGSSFRQSSVNFTLGSGAINWTSFGTSAPAATETVAGVAELATQAEVNAGSDTGRIVTPATLAASSLLLKKFAATIGDGSATSFNIDHNFNTRDVTVAVTLNSGNYDDILVDVTRPTVNRVTVTFAAAPALNSHRVLVIG